MLEPCFLYSLQNHEPQGVKHQLVPCQLSMFQLSATPPSALADDPVHIHVTGLPPLQLVTLKASLKDEKGNLFRSMAFYRANEGKALSRSH